MRITLLLSRFALRTGKERERSRLFTREREVLEDKGGFFRKMAKQPFAFPLVTANWLVSPKSKEQDEK